MGSSWSSCRAYPKGYPDTKGRRKCGARLVGGPLGKLAWGLRHWPTRCSQPEAVDYLTMDGSPYLLVKELRSEGGAVPNSVYDAEDGRMHGKHLQGGDATT